MICICRTAVLGLALPFLRCSHVPRGAIARAGHKQPPTLRSRVTTGERLLGAVCFILKHVCYDLRMSGR